MNDIQNHYLTSNTKKEEKTNDGNDNMKNNSANKEDENKKIWENVVLPNSTNMYYNNNTQINFNKGGWNGDGNTSFDNGVEDCNIYFGNANQNVNKDGMTMNNMAKIPLPNNNKTGMNLNNNFIPPNSININNTQYNKNQLCVKKNEMNKQKISQIGLKNKPFPILPSPCVQINKSFSASFTPRNQISNQKNDNNNIDYDMLHANNSSNKKPQPLDFLEPIQNDYAMIQYKTTTPLFSPNLNIINKGNNVNTTYKAEPFRNFNIDNKMHFSKYMQRGDITPSQNSSAFLNDTFNLDTTFFINALTSENVDPQNQQNQQQPISLNYSQRQQSNVYQIPQGESQVYNNDELNKNNNHYMFHSKPNDAVLNKKRIRNSPLNNLNISTLNAIQSPHNDGFIPPKNPRNYGYKSTKNIMTNPQKQTISPNINVNFNNQTLLNTSNWKRFMNHNQSEPSTPDYKGNNYFDQVDLAFEEFDEYNNHSPIIDPNKKLFNQTSNSILNVDNSMLLEQNDVINKNQSVREFETSMYDKEIKPYKSKIIICEKEGKTSVTAMVSNDHLNGNKNIPKVNTNENETHKDLRSNSFKHNNQGEANELNQQSTEHNGNNVEQPYSNVKTNENEVISTFDDGTHNQRSKIYSQSVEKEINNDDKLSQNVNKFTTKKEDLNYNNTNGKKKNTKKQGTATKKRKMSKKKEEKKKEDNNKPEINEVNNNENHG